MTERVRVSVDEQGVATLSMCDEAGKNAFSLAFVRELESKLAELDANEEAKVCVLTGLDEVFCAGGDRDVLMRLADKKVAPYDLGLTRSLLELRIPSVAAMAGHAVGGGLLFGLCCDMVYMGRESRYGLNFMELGFTPGMGTTRLVQAAFGDYLAAEMMYGCRYIRGKELEGKARVNGIMPKAQVEPAAQQLASRIAEKPRFALDLLKRSLGLPRRLAFEQARTMESVMHEVCFAHPETRARIEESYLEED